MPLIFGTNFYEGYIKARGRRYFVKILLRNTCDWNVKDLVVDWRLYSLLGDLLHHFIEANSKNISFVDFFWKLENFVQLNLKDENDLWSCNPLKAFNLYKSLEGEIKEVGHLVKNVNADEGLIQIEFVDLALRVHNAVLKYTENYPDDSVKVINHELPLCDENFFQNNEVNTISEFCKKFVQCVDGFQDFWDSVSVLDSKCWVLDPDIPTFKDTTRRIKISDRISVILLLNPYKSQHRPDIKFVGCHSTVTEFREILQRNLENEVWDPNLDILTNLNNVLEVTFPMKPTVTKGEDPHSLVQTGECVICFTLRLNDELPSIICDNCLSNYHTFCLSTYLRSIPKNTYLFGRIQGECPNCNEVIFCPIENPE